MATIRTYKTADGRTRYQAYVRLKGFPTESETFGRRLDAQRWAKTREDELTEHRLFGRRDDRRRTVQEAIDRHQAKHGDGYAPGYRRARAAAFAFWGARLGQVRLYELTPIMIDDGRDALVATGSSPATVNRYVAALSSVLQAAIREWQWLVSNPCRALKQLKEPRGRELFLTPAQAQELLAAASRSSQELADWIAMALSTGARHGELAKLRWSDLDFRRSTVRFKDTKNSDDKTVPMTASAREVLRRRRLVLPLPDRVFGEWPRKRFEQVKRELGREDLHFHDLRHTCASWLAMAGATLLEIGQVLGHRTAIATRRYAHLTMEHTSDLLHAATASLHPEAASDDLPTSSRRRPFG